MSRSLQFFLIGLVLIAPEIVWAAEEFDQEAANNYLDRVSQRFLTGAEEWESGLRSLGQRLFFSLAAIQLSWSGIQLALKGGAAEEWIATIGREILIIGFFYVLLFQYLVWTGAIQAFFDEGMLLATGEQELKPSNVLERGVNLAVTMISDGGWRSYLNLTMLVKVVAAFIVAIAFIMVAITVVLVLAEAYLVIAAGVLFMGFGGSSWTQEYALKFLKYALGIAAKLFILQLLITSATNALDDIADFSGTVPGAFYIVAGALMLLALVNSLPDMVQQMLTGTSSSSGRALVQAAGTAAMATNAALGTMGAATQAAKEGGQAYSKAIGGGASGKLAAMSGVGAGLNSLAKAAGEQMTATTTGGQMRDRMQKNAADFAATQAEKAAGSPGQPGGGAGISVVPGNSLSEQSAPRPFQE